MAQEYLFSLMKTMSEEVNGENRRKISLFLEELDKVLGEMKNKNGIESSINVGEKQKNYRCMIQVYARRKVREGIMMEVRLKGIMSVEREREVEMNKFNRRVTRIQGAVVDQPWVMPRTIEHEKKGRPQH